MLILTAKQTCLIFFYCIFPILREFLILQFYRFSSIRENIKTQRPISHDRISEQFISVRKIKARFKNPRDVPLSILRRY